MNEEYILTPKSDEKPRINGARVFGVRPEAPFLFKIPASGKKPLSYNVLNLPEGLQVNPKTGIITGKIKQKGTYKVQFEVKNVLGRVKRDFRIEVGDKICLTPPMGWNSWYVHSLWVSQQKIEDIIKSMHDKGLTEHGWTYVNIDDCWQGHRDEKTKALLPNEKFPDMKALADKAHDLGIKLGIYSTPWVGSYAGYIGGSADDEKIDYSKYEVPPEKRLEKYQIFGNEDISRRPVRHFGLYLGEQDAQSWAEWGIDYLKYDWNPNDVEHVSQMLQSLRKCGRDIVYSLSNSAPFAHVEDWVKLANVWRTTGDIQDNWKSISRIGFSQSRWIPYAGPSHWNDPDMLQIGNTAHPHEPASEFFPTHLTPNEQYTQMSLWCLLAAPLLLSCDIASMDDFTLSLLTNDEVIDINQDPLGKAARQVKKGIWKEIWEKKLEDNSKAIGLFNKGPMDMDITLKLDKIYLIRDLWRQEDLGEFEGKFTCKIASHGVKLIRLIQK